MIVARLPPTANLGSLLPHREKDRMKEYWKSAFQPWSTPLIPTLSPAALREGGWWDSSE